LVTPLRSCCGVPDGLKQTDDEREEEMPLSLEISILPVAVILFSLYPEELQQKMMPFALHLTEGTLLIGQI
jgi:hypothetical protein